MNIAVLIPSLDPNERLGTLVSALRQRGVTQLVVIDDGSAARTQPILTSVLLLAVLLSITTAIAEKARHCAPDCALHASVFRILPALSPQTATDSIASTIFSAWHTLWKRQQAVLFSAHAIFPAVMSHFAADSEIASPRCFSAFLRVSAVRTHRPVCAAFPPRCLISLCRFPAAGMSTR